MIEQEEEVEIISVREEQIKELISQFIKGEKHLSFSSLKAFAENPAEFIQYCLREKKTTAAMKFGTLLHALVLEPDSIDEAYAVMDDTEIYNRLVKEGSKSPRQTIKYKEWKAEFEQSTMGREVVSITDFIAASAIANNVNFNTASSKILKACTERETHVEWTYESHKFRGFIDAKTPKDAKQRMVMDLKSCQNANPLFFQREIIKNKYYLQGPMYLTAEGDTDIPYLIVAADRKGGVSVHRLDPRLIKYGMEEYKRLLDNFNSCLIKDSFNQSYEFWSGKWDGIYDMKKPTFME